uniref:Ig-like domain-containing protein n=1 Tax=Monopterus albus TaxID=43700 RepID=A0A3Q3JMM3_MONAL
PACVCAFQPVLILTLNSRIAEIIEVAPLGSSVLLPCHFTSNKDSWVSWAHPVIDLVNLTSKGFIKFLDPKSGRLKVFPNQASMGNYTIRIDELEVSDLGCYRCVWKNNCHQVELVAETCEYIFLLKDFKVMFSFFLQVFLFLS